MERWHCHGEKNYKGTTIDTAQKNNIIAIALVNYLYKSIVCTLLVCELKLLPLVDLQFTLRCLTVLCKLVVSLQMQNRKTTDKINEISIVPNPPNYSIVAIADKRALHLHFATDNQLAKPCKCMITGMSACRYQTTLITSPMTFAKASCECN